MRGVRPGKRTNNSLMILKLGGIAAIGVLMLVKRPAAATVYHLPAVSEVTLTALFAALVPVLFAYGGWQNCGSLAAEIRDAGRTLARANILGVALVVVVYVGLNWVYLRVLPPAEVAASTALAADVARALAGELGARFVAALTVVSCLGFLAVITMTGPRLYYAMAEDGLFLRRAARLHPRFGTPSFTLRLQAGVALVLLFSQTYDQLLSYVVFCDWLFFGLTAAGTLRPAPRHAATAQPPTSAPPVIPGRRRSSSPSPPASSPTASSPPRARRQPAAPSSRSAPRRIWSTAGRPGGAESRAGATSKAGG